MTVTYSNDIATARLGALLKLLFLRWHGSVMKLLWRELLAYLTLFFMIHGVYLWILNDDGKATFVTFVGYFKSYLNVIPLPFVLGFYVSNVTIRWWEQYMVIPWPYSIALFVSSNIEGYDEVGRAFRRTIMRYVCVSLTLVFRVLSPRVKSRFPRLSGLVDAGLLTANETAIIEDMEKKYPGYNKNFMPIVWAASLVNKARAQGRIRDDFAVKTMIDELNKFRSSCSHLLNISTVNFPLVYTQVVSIAVFVYFLALVLSEQYIENAKQDTPWKLDHLPINVSLMFIVYMGWLKVAETMLNPFGENDDDFEVNYLIDRNIITSYMIVDEMHKEHPELLKDPFWNKLPEKLPYPFSAEKERHNIFGQNEYDTEAPEAPATSRKVSSASNYESLKPRHVIDEKYMNVKDVEVQQSSLEREMQMIREKNSYESKLTASSGESTQVAVWPLGSDESSQSKESKSSNGSKTSSEKKKQA